MDLKTYVSERGRQTWLAQLIEAQPQLVWQWANGVKPVPADRCPGIERATDGSVTCEEMRSDVRWARVPDKAWPHPQGRPTIDVAAPETAPAVPKSTSDHAQAHGRRASDTERPDETTYERLNREQGDQLERAVGLNRRQSDKRDKRDKRFDDGKQRGGRRG